VRNEKLPLATHQNTKGTREARRRCRAATALGVGSLPTWRVPLRSMSRALIPKLLLELELVRLGTKVISPRHAGSWRIHALGASVVN
jgi:hypothetical protein